MKLFITILVTFLLINLCNLSAITTEKIHSFDNINAQEIYKYDDNLIFLQSFNKIFVSKDKMKTWELFYEAKDVIGKKANEEYYLNFSMMDIGNDIPRIIIEASQSSQKSEGNHKFDKIYTDDLGLSWKDFNDIVFLDVEGKRHSILSLFYFHNEDFSLKANYMRSSVSYDFYLIDKMNKSKDTFSLKICRYKDRCPNINEKIAFDGKNIYVYFQSFEESCIIKTSIGSNEFVKYGNNQQTILGFDINKFSNEVIYFDSYNKCIKISKDNGMSEDTIYVFEDKIQFMNTRTYSTFIYTLDSNNYILIADILPFLINSKDSTVVKLPTYMSYLKDVITIEDKWFVTSPIGLLYSTGDFTKWEIYNTNISSQEIVQTKYSDGFWHRISKYPNWYPQFEYYSNNSKSNYKYNNRFKHYANSYKSNKIDKGSIIRTNNNTLITSNMFDYFVSSDNGDTWDSIPEINEKHKYRTKKFCQFDSETIYCFVNGDFLASRDEGKSWNFEMGNINYNFLDLCPAKDSDTLFATTKGIKKGDSTGYVKSFLNLENRIDNIHYVKNQDLVITHYLDSITRHYKIHRYFNYGENEKITEINLEKILYIDTLISEEIISYTSDNWGNVYLLSPYNIYILNHNSDEIEIIKPSAGERFTYIDFDYIDDNQIEKVIYYTTNTSIFKLSNPTSVENEAVNNNFKIIPNPVSDRFKLELSNEIAKTKIIEMKLIDDTGRVIIEKIENLQNINISSFSVGNYFIQIKYFDNEIKTEMCKLVKE